MRIKVLIIGKKSFIGQNIYRRLRRKLHIVCLSFENVEKKKILFLKDLNLLLIVLLKLIILKKNIKKTMILIYF